MAFEMGSSVIPHWSVRLYRKRTQIMGINNKERSPTASSSDHKEFYLYELYNRISFKHMLISPTSFIAKPNTIRILHNTSRLSDTLSQNL
jgi:hypothetical protein